MSDRITGIEFRIDKLAEKIEQKFDKAAYHMMNVKEQLERTQGYLDGKIESLATKEYTSSAIQNHMDKCPFGKKDNRLIIGVVTACLTAMGSLAIGIFKLMN